MGLVLYTWTALFAFVNGEANLIRHNTKGGGAVRAMLSLLALSVSLTGFPMRSVRESLTWLAGFCV